MKHNYIYKYKNVRIRPLEMADIEKMRIWRNNSKNTKYLKKIPYITSEMQVNWYHRVQANPEEIVFAIDEYDGDYRFVGSFSLYNFSNNKAEFGKFLIGDENAHGKNIGCNSIKAASEIAFNQLKLTSLYLHVFTENLPAIKCYQKAGFVVEDEHLNDGQKEYTMILNNMEEKQNGTQYE